MATVATASMLPTEDSTFLAEETLAGRNLQQFNDDYDDEEDEEESEPLDLEDDMYGDEDDESESPEEQKPSW